MERIIILKDKKAKEKVKDILRKAHNLKACDMILSHALTFNRNSERDIRIRITAMKNGGKLMCEVEDWNYELLK